ncbi:MAG: hypothetical protein PHC88_15080 [Terrimicrobiaceae bacterium]|nr:hypothetical protein [Terrimicrobiaceae bacterium]
MRWFHRALAAAALLIAGCATEPTAPTPAYIRTLVTLHVAPATLQRIEAGRVLAYSDVLELVQRGVPGNKIVAYLRSTRAPYNYTQKQVNALLAAGADSTLINYVGRSQGDFLIDAQDAQGQAELRQNAKWKKEAWRDPYFNDPAYWGVAPFPYAYPGEWY